MAEDHIHNTPRGWLRALYDLVSGSGSSEHAAGTRTLTRAPDEVPARIGHYVIDGKLGEGGMGVVYAAHDERLGRRVALKMISSVANDETARKRFWREARAAASVNHPNICQLYEIGEDDGELFIAMELLEGEALSTRLLDGPMGVSETIPIGLAILAALSALHRRGIVHRDLKPSNVFLTPHGVKLLDFGLARPSDPALARSLSSSGDLTASGMLVGTPGFIAPEQLTGEILDARTDLFAAGAILFEMLAGRPAFDGRTVFAILDATLHEQPPALTGSPAVIAMDRVIRRALAKRPAERQASAAAMAEELRAVRGVSGDDIATPAVALTRIVVLPFRVLRPDPETDFLAFSLPDAIATSLSGISSLVVRSSSTAARFAGEAPDLKTLAADADVDRVVMGTLLRSGDQLRVATQLVEAPEGTLLRSHAVQSSMGDLFRLQDDIARRVVEALALPLATRDTPSATRNPASGRAYELYLRANELARTYDGLPRARELYERSLELDPTFAPAWAHLGRCHRVIGKYVTDSPDSEALAEQALKRALELNPRLSLAHKFYAQLEADMGEPRHALVRLLGEATRHGNDPELFAGLVHACRYCGLYEQSIAAHEEARRLDPNVPTSLEQTLLMTGDIDRLLAVELPILVAGADDFIRIIALGLAGRREEARKRLADSRPSSRIPSFRLWGEIVLAWLDRRADDMLGGLSAVGPLKILADPEAIFQEGWLLCDIGEHERGLARLEGGVAKGYCPAPTLAHARAFDALRGDPAFKKIVAHAEAGREQALAAFREGGGERLLGRT
jgi:serine/threonine protein kinase/tetratricopeptide (TPR) repeat protein